MKRSLGLVWLLAWVLLGAALECPGPYVRFPDDLLLAYTAVEEAPPVLKKLGVEDPVSVDWQKKVLSEGRVQWQAKAALSEGMWFLTTDRGCCGFLVVNPLFAIVEILGPPGYTVKIVTSSGQTHMGVIPALHPLTFLIKPAAAETAWISWGSTPECPVKTREIFLWPGARVRVPQIFLQTTSAKALPGTSVAVGFSSASDRGDLVDLLLFSLDISLPSGWSMEFAGLTECCATYEGFVPWFFVHVPPDAAPGEYELLVRAQSPDFAYQFVLQLQVVLTLSPKEVVGHWDVAGQKLDLTQPYAITYERLLWAATLLGQKLPYTEMVMTRELWQELAEEWVGSAAKQGED